MARDDDDLVIRAVDARKAGYCLVPGVRDFLTQHGYSFRDFVKNGLPLKVAETMNDHMVNRVVEHARARGRNES